MEAAFWDSSALVPLCIRESSTPKAHELGAIYNKVVWWSAPVEIRSAFARLVKIGSLTSRDTVQAHVRLDQLRGGWREVPPSDALRERAEAHVERFVLKAADALQLAAAWIWCQGHPRNRRFISGDVQLLDAARKLGFTALPI